MIFQPMTPLRIHLLLTNVSSYAPKKTYRTRHLFLWLGAILFLFPTVGLTVAWAFGYALLMVLR